MARICTIPNCNNLVFRTDKITRNGYCQNHYRQHSTDLDKRPLSVIAQEKALKKQKIKPIPLSEISSVRKLIDKNVNIVGGAELQRWFNDRRKEMTGFCQNCGGKSCKDDDKCFKFSLAHLLPKAYFKSIATHPDNWLELCFFGNSCHTNFDNKMIDIMDLSCFDTVIQKFVKLYPSIATDEKRRIPAVLIEYLKNEI